MVTDLQLYLLAGVPTVAVICAHLVFTICLKRAMRQINSRFDSVEQRMESMFSRHGSS